MPLVFLGYLCCCFFSVCSDLSLAEPLPQAVLAAKLQRITSWQATFTQTTVTGSTKTHKATGQIYLSKPSKLRIEINDPYQLYIINAERVVSYDKALDQAVIHKTSSQNILQYPLYLLTSDSAKVFNTGQLIVKQLNSHCFELTPKNLENGYEWARFCFNSKNELAKLTIKLTSEQLIEFKFQNHRHPISFDDSRFKFIPKPSTEVLED